MTVMLHFPAAGSLGLEVGAEDLAGGRDWLPSSDH